MEGSGNSGESQESIQSEAKLRHNDIHDLSEVGEFSTEHLIN